MTGQIIYCVNANVCVCVFLSKSGRISSDFQATSAVTDEQYSHALFTIYFCTAAAA